MLRRDKWWVREIERINREHARERASLIATIAHLTGRPLPADTPPEREPEDDSDARFDLVVPDYLDS